MTALTDLSAIANRLTGGNSGTPENLFYWIDNRVGAAAASATVAGRLTSTWTWNKHPLGAGAVPTTSAIPVNTTAGALGQTDPAGGREKWLLGGAVSPSQIGSIILYDRLVHTGGLDGTVTTAQTTNLPTTALTRYTNGVGNQIWVEIYTIIGATGTTATVSYTNGTPTAGRTSQSFAIGGTGARESERVIVVPLQDGDKTVVSVENIDLVATTGTAGNFGITIVHPLLVIPCGAGGAGAVFDCLSRFPSLPEIEVDACLGIAWLANGTTAPQIFGNLSMIES